MKLAISETEIRELVAAIEQGTVQVTPTEEPQAVYAGVVEYVASNGWRLAVFNDCNEWDYLQWVVAPDGRRVDYDQLDDFARELSQYQPDETVAWERYGIPKYPTFRCTVCGTILESGKRKVFKCDLCLK